MNFRIQTSAEIGAFMKSIFEFGGDRKIWLFEGAMGAGKTTLIKEVCKYLKIVDAVSSPTFSLVNVYETSSGEECFHFDFYRIEDEMEAVDIGCDEYFYSGNYCFIEWSERIPNLIPQQYLKINIKLDTENNRLIELSQHD
ncbi:MAG: tRNA (adenosine(37)-N6)-threonylcarbamoyltransferase complex ATPase subunit type 1 TsaE [Reichenbachiella sp.]